jgi:Na+-driven multidrug efflux pump
VCGIFAETLFAIWRARTTAAPPETSDAPPRNVLAFGLPLMLANFLGVAAGLLYLRIAAMVPESHQAASLAGYQEVRSLQWMLSAGVFAMQSLTTAKVQSPRDVAPMVRFALMVGGGLSAVFALIAFTPLHDWVLVDLMNEQAGGAVVTFAEPALRLAVAMPLLNALRFAMRGVLIARGHSVGITLSNVVTLLFVGAAMFFGALPSRVNGVWNVYVLWTVALVAECVILVFLVYGRWGDRSFPAPARTAREAAAG